MLLLVGQNPNFIQRVTQRPHVNRGLSSGGSGGGIPFVFGGCGLKIPCRVRRRRLLLLVVLVGSITASSHTAIRIRPLMMLLMWKGREALQRLFELCRVPQDITSNCGRPIVVTRRCAARVAGGRRGRLIHLLDPQPMQRLQLLDHLFGLSQRNELHSSSTRRFNGDKRVPH